MIKVWKSEQRYPVQSDDFTLNGYGIQEPMPPGIVDRPVGTGDHLIMFFFDPVEVTRDGRQVHVPANTLMVWQPGSHQYYGNRMHGYNHTWIHCDGQLVRHMLKTCGIPLDAPIAGVSGSHFEHHIAAIHFECSQAARPDHRIVQNHICNLVFEVQRAVGREEPARFVPSDLLQARQYIEAHHRERITLPQLAAMANLSPQHFCTLFREAFGRPPISYLLSYRLAQAAYLLLDRNMRVGEVARRVGIEDVYYFSRMFKRLYGKSPRQMRGAPV